MRTTRHDRVRRRLPELVHDELSWWRARLVERHLRRCADCAEEAARQRQVAAGLDELGEVVERPLDDVEAPHDLLERLLEDARDPGLRQRVAAPARGAVSGARPGLSAALVVLVLAAAGLAVWAGWRLAHAWEDGLRGDAAD